MLLEQAGYCEGRAGSPTGKFGFHMVMAGSLYSKCGQEKHAVHCYKVAQPLYKDSGWNFIEDHLSMTLGRWVYKLGFADECVASWSAVLERGSQNAAKQAILMRDFTTVVKRHIADHGDDKDWQVAMPRVDCESCAARLQPNGGDFSPPGAPGSQDAVNKLLRSRMKITMSPSRNEIPLGEVLLVDVAFENPLSIALHIKNVRLVAFLDGVALLDDGSGIDVLLGPNESKTVVLKLMPEAKGVLEIIGVRWRLLDLVNVMRRFEFRGKLLHKTRDQRASRARARDTRMQWHVIAKAPLLKLSCNLPHAAYNGEIVKGSLIMENIGDIPCGTNFILGYSGPFLVLVDDAVPEDEMGRVVRFRSCQSTIMEPGASITVPVKVLAKGEGGESHLNIAVRYSETAEKWSHAQLIHHIHLIPSIDVAVSTRPAYEAPGAYMLMVKTDAPLVGTTEWNVGPCVSKVTCGIWSTLGSQKVNLVQLYLVHRMCTFLS